MLPELDPGAAAELLRTVDWDLSADQLPSGRPSSGSMTLILQPFSKRWQSLTSCSGCIPRAHQG
jgi:hypothetical protein